MFKEKADQDIIAGLKTGGPSAEAHMRYLYQQMREPLIAYLEQQGAGQEEAKDIFQEALLSLYENLRADRFREQSSIKTYLISIARFIWLNQLKRADKLRDIKEDLPRVRLTENHIHAYLSRERDQQLARFLELLQADCQRVLRYAYYENWSAKELAEEMGYKNEQIARNKKSKCLQKLRQLLKGHSSWQAYFKNSSHE